MNKTMAELDNTRRGIAQRVGVMEKEMRVLKSRMRDLEVRLENTTSEIEDLEKDYAIVDECLQEDTSLDKDHIRSIAKEISLLSECLWWRSKKEELSKDDILKLSETLKRCCTDLEELTGE